MSIAAPTRPNLAFPQFKIYRLILLQGYFTALFVLLLVPVRQLNYSAAKVADGRLVNYEAFYQSEVTADGRRYAWTRPDARLYFNDMPRYAPLRFQIDLNFDRPGEVAPARLQLTEIRNREPSLLLLNLVADPQRPGFHTYTLTVPPCATCETGLTIELKSNGVKPPGETRTLGVVAGNFGVALGLGHYRYLLWPQPYFVAVLLIGLALVMWLGRMNCGWPESLLWLTPPALSLAIFSPVLYDDSWWLVGLALVLLVTALVRVRLPQILGLLLACTALITIFAIVPLYATDIKDLQLYQNWLKDLQRVGPFNLYSSSPSLDYLPLLLYILWFYSLITAPFGLTDSAIALKLFFSIPILLNLYLLWRFTIYDLRFLVTQNSKLTSEGWSSTKTQNSKLKTQNFLIFAFSATLIFNSAVWGQTDTLLACMLVWTLMVVQTRHPLLAGALLGLDVALKPQSWIVAPLLALFILKDYGWRKTLVAGCVGFGLLFGFSAPAFGFDPASFQRFFFQPAFAGELNLGSVNAYNLLYLFGYGTKEAPQLIAYAGFALIGLVYLLVAARIWWRTPAKTAEPVGASSTRDFPVATQIYWTQQALAAGLVLIIFFLCAIKMRERYIEYGLVFVGLAAFYAGLKGGAHARRLLLIFLGLDLLSMLNLLPVFVVHRNEQDYNTIYLWREIILADWLPSLVALGITAAFGYLLYLFLKACLIIR